MRILIDAEVVSAYYCEGVLGQCETLTAPSAMLFDRLSFEDALYLDSGGQIEQEWRNLVDHDWFEAWLSDLVVNGRVLRVETSTCSSLLKHLADKFGFPAASGDKWYIRTAKAVSEGDDPAVLVTEDAHFHEPKCQAKPARRARVLRDSEGAMARYL